MYESYRALTASEPDIVDLLALKSPEVIDFDPPKVQGLARPAALD